MNASLVRAIVACTCAASLLEAQQPDMHPQPSSALTGDFTAGSPTEYTLRVLNLLSARPVPVLLRPFSAVEAERIIAPGSDSVQRRSGWLHARWTPAVLTTSVSTARARDEQDGAIWQGRGITASATAGFLAEIGVFTLAVRPLVFATQNLTFDPAPGVPFGAGDFRHPFPQTGPFIDLPYRFGDGAVSRWSPGESWLRLDWDRLSAGVTTASQAWGPAIRHNLLMGTEAGGYPRAFFSVRSLPVGFGWVTMDWSLGRLESSGYAQLPAGQRSRAAPAAVASMQLRGLPGVEAGAGRLFHERWTEEAITLGTALRPFSELLKDRAPERSIAGNQVAAAFVRVAPPGMGLEVYTEFFRDDHNANLRDLAAEPDHLSAYVLGFRRAWESGSTVRALTLEMANGRISHLDRLREQPPVYVHHLVYEGHTYQGQALGTSAVVGGGGWNIIADLIGARRATSLELALRRTAQEAEGGVWQGRQSGRITAQLRQSIFTRAGLHRWSVGVEGGYGLDRGWNAFVSHALTLTRAPLATATRPHRQREQ